MIPAALHSPAGNPWSERTGVVLRTGGIEEAGDLALSEIDGAAARAAIEDHVRTAVNCRV